MKIIITLVCIAWPLIEIGVLIKVGQSLGFWPTMGIVVMTGVAGFSVIVLHGFEAMLRVQQAILRGEPPVAAMQDGALVAIAGVLLITPGLVADAVGLVLLVPLCRRWIIGRIGRAFEGGMSPSAPGETGEWTFESTRKERASRPGNGPVIEGEFKRLDEPSSDIDGNDRDRGRPSGA